MQPPAEELQHYAADAKNTKKKLKPSKNRRKRSVFWPQAYSWYNRAGNPDIPGNNRSDGYTLVLCLVIRNIVFPIPWGIGIADGHFQ